MESTGSGSTPEESLAAGTEKPWRQLRGVLEGKFRQIQLQPLAVEDAALFYDRAKRCKSNAAVLGHPGPACCGRNMPKMDSWARLAAAGSNRADGSGSCGMSAGAIPSLVLDGSSLVRRDQPRCWY